MSIRYTIQRKPTYRPWHQVLPASIEGTLAPIDLNDLSAEFLVSAFPLRTDLLYRQHAKPLGKAHPVAQIFRTHNLIELKSPADRLDPLGYNQGIVYVRLYQLRFLPNDYLFRELTLTFICTKKPVLLFSYLATLNLQVIRDSPVPGIFQVIGEPFPVQIVVLDLLNDSQIAVPFTPLISADVRERLKLMRRLVTELQNNPQSSAWREIYNFCLNHSILTDNEIEEVHEMFWTGENEDSEWKSYVEKIKKTRAGQCITEEALVQGHAQGLSQGILLGKKDIIQAAIRNGAEITYLAKLIGCSEYEILQLQGEM